MKPPFASADLSLFTFEVVWHGEAPVIAHVVELPDRRAVWCHAEALALRISNRGSAFIRVKNSEDETIIRTGVATALASIETCSSVACPLKRELVERRVPALRYAATDLAFKRNPCVRRRIGQSIVPKSDNAH